VAPPRGRQMLRFCDIGLVLSFSVCSSSLIQVAFLVKLRSYMQLTCLPFQSSEPKISLLEGLSTKNTKISTSFCNSPMCYASVLKNQRWHHGSRLDYLTNLNQIWWESYDFGLEQITSKTQNDQNSRWWLPPSWTSRSRYHLFFIHWTDLKQYWQGILSGRGSLQYWLTFKTSLHNTLLTSGMICSNKIQDGDTRHLEFSNIAAISWQLTLIKNSGNVKSSMRTRFCHRKW